MTIHLRIRIDRQRLEVLRGDAVIRVFTVSTAARGPGERRGSGGTPRGRHEVRAMIGAGAPRGAVFAGRRPTGEICTPRLVAAHPQRDWITSRILWLRGLEVGRNRLGDVDTMRRFIYIHGTPHAGLLGTPASHGCVRMGDGDVVELFDLVRPGVGVEIVSAAVAAKPRPAATGGSRRRGSRSAPAP